MRHNLKGRSGREETPPPPHAAAARTPFVRRLNRDERRAALLAAAMEVSLEQGLDAVNLDAIIRRTGGSRRSIYTAFGGKEGLLVAMEAEIAKEILSMDEVGKSGDLSVALTQFAHNLVTVLMSARGIALSRIIMQDTLSSPERAKTFFEQGPGKGARLLAEILETARARGEIEAEDCLAAAHAFIGMVRGNLYLELALRLRAPLDEEEVKTHVNRVVKLFLNGVRPRAAK
jgi:AcrR family transcriptional regulator